MTVDYYYQEVLMLTYLQKYTGLASEERGQKLAHCSPPVYWIVILKTVERTVSLYLSPFFFFFLKITWLTIKGNKQLIKHMFKSVNLPGKECHLIHEGKTQY